VGGDIGITGGGLRPVEPVSPLQNDRSFAARLEPHTPRFGVIGHAVVPGWDDPPWTSGRSGGPPRVQPVEAGASSGRAAARESVWRRYAPPVRTASQAGPGPVGEADRTRAPAPASAADESDWVDPRPIPSVAARPRQDVRPDVRLAARLASEGRTRGAVDTLRQAVYRDAEAFSGAGGPLVTDADTLALLRQAIAAYREGGHTGVSAADSAFMAAAMEAASGDGDAAFEAIRTARQAGEDRPSGKALHRVLSRGRVSSESQPASGVQP
jgi:hypothetical protein